MKGIWAVILIAVVVGFVIGVIFANPVVEAANSQGQPFQELQEAIDVIATEIVALQLVSHEPLTVTDIEGFGFELGPHTDLGTIPAEIVALTQQVADLQDEVADLEAQLAELQGPDCIVILIAQDANFSGCDFSGADFSGASLLSADFSGANLSGANLSNAFFQFADFSDADLSGANFSGAILADADFSGSNLQDAIGAPFVGCINHPSCV